MYRIGDICATWASEESELKTIEDCRMAMVLIAILSGGDYAPEGASRMGLLQDGETANNQVQPKPWD